MKKKEVMKKKSRSSWVLLGTESIVLTGLEMMWIISYAGYALSKNC